MVQFDGLRPARLKVGIISAGRYGIWPKHLRKTRAK